MIPPFLPSTSPAAVLVLVWCSTLNEFLMLVLVLILVLVLDLDLELDLVPVLAFDPTFDLALFSCSCGKAILGLGSCPCSGPCSGVRPGSCPRVGVGPGVGGGLIQPNTSKSYVSQD